MPDPYNLLEITFPPGWLRAGGRRYIINLRKPPKNPAQGWVIGRHPRESDIVLSEDFSFLGRRWLSVKLRDEGLFILSSSITRSSLTYHLEGDSDTRKRAKFCWMFFENCEAVTLTVDGKESEAPVGLRRPEQNDATTLLHRQAVAEYLRLFSSSGRDVNTTEAAPQQALTSDALAMLSTQLPTGAQTSEGNDFFYLRQGVLGHGQRGHVRLSRRYTDGHWVALKTLRHQDRGVEANREILRKWNREIEINRILIEHPSEYICNCIEISPKDSEFAMDYCPVGTLMQIDLKKAELPVLATQLFAALAHLDQISIVHGDINLHNIYVFQRHPLHIKLGDFSESFSSAQLGRLRQRLERGYGARGYRAPEWGAEMSLVPPEILPPNINNLDELDRIRAESPVGTFEFEEELVGEGSQPGPLSDVWSAGKLITLEILPDEPSSIQLSFRAYEKLCEEYGENDPLCKLLSTVAVRVRPQQRRSASQILTRLLTEFPDSDITSETRETGMTQTAPPTEFRTEPFTEYPSSNAQTITTEAENGQTSGNEPVSRSNPLDQLEQFQTARRNAADTRERVTNWGQQAGLRPRTARPSS